jgi:hypothetical protein
VFRTTGADVGKPEGMPYELTGVVCFCSADGIPYVLIGVVFIAGFEAEYPCSAEGIPYVLVTGLGFEAEYPCNDEGIPLFVVAVGNVLTGLFTVVFGAYRSL